ncbi:MAG: non-homologous end-joining DNA ligase [Acidimicrobiia bacterium]
MAQRQASGTDPLATYKAKRDFASTPEPAGETPTPDPEIQPRFVVQEHRARALHWDLRLEREGVLVSWAVPKGIPPDPKKNHLAVQTEDHPLEYLTFAGEIPVGEYGAGTMRVWDTGTYETHKFEPDEVQISFHGERVRGRYVLFRTKDKNWMIHRMDPPEDPDRAVAPEGLRPMAATLATTPPRGEGWAWELKWDGIRALGYADGGRIRLFTRNGRDISHRYPELRQVGVELGARDAVLDGEIVAFDDDGRPSFELFQRRMHVDGANAIRKMAQEVPVVYVLFDLLWLDGHSLMSEPYEERRAQLLGLGLTGSSWQTPPHEVGDGAATRDVSERFGLEGVVAKRLDSPYEPGRRSRSWLKLKNTTRQEFVVGGWMPGEKGRSGSIGSLLIGYYDDGVLCYAARVGSGLRQRDLAELERLFERCARDTSPFTKGSVPKGARWVEPVLVVDVKFANWTAAGGIRAPVFLGYRTDKDPEEVVRE